LRTSAAAAAPAAPDCLVIWIAVHHGASATAGAARPRRLDDPGGLDLDPLAALHVAGHAPITTTDFALTSACEVAPP
jgi:hypothetical protein